MIGKRWRFLAQGKGAAAEVTPQLGADHAQIIGHLLSDDLKARIMVLAPGQTTPNPHPKDAGVAFPRWVIYSPTNRERFGELAGWITPKLAKSITQRLANATQASVAMIREFHGGRTNPEIKPVAGEVWKGIMGDRVRVKAVGPRIIFTDEQGNRHYATSEEFGQHYKPVAPRATNPGSGGLLSHHFTTGNFTVSMPREAALEIGAQGENESAIERWRQEITRPKSATKQAVIRELMHQGYDREAVPPEFDFDNWDKILSIAADNISDEQGFENPRKRRNPGDYVPVAQAAKELRAALKRHFPTIKFSVRSKSYSGGASITVSYENGPRSSDVDRIAQRFSGADFDGMTDLKTHHDTLLVGPDGAMRSVRYGADFVFVNRSTSPTLQAAVIKEFGATWNPTQWAKMPDYEKERMAWRGISAISIPDNEPEAVTAARAREAFFRGEGLTATNPSRSPAARELRASSRLKTLKPRRLYRAQAAGRRDKAGRFLSDTIRRGMAHTATPAELAYRNPSAGPYRIGQRVELHPATDEWMQGDRYGEVVGYGRAREFVDSFTKERFKARPVKVKLDKSGRVRRFHPENVTAIEDNPTAWTNEAVFAALPERDRPGHKSRAFFFLSHLADHVQSGAAWNDPKWRIANFHAGAYHSLYASVKRAIQGKPNPGGGKAWKPGREVYPGRNLPDGSSISGEGWKSKRSAEAALARQRVVPGDRPMSLVKINGWWHIKWGNFPRINPRGKGLAPGSPVIYSGPAHWYEREESTHTLASGNSQKRYDEPATVVRAGNFGRYLVRSTRDGRLAWADRSRLDLSAGNPRGGPRIVHNRLLGGWFVVVGPHQTPITGRFDSKAEAQAWLAGEGRRKNPASWWTKHKAAINRALKQLGEKRMNAAEWHWALGVTGGHPEDLAYRIQAQRKEGRTSNPTRPIPYPICPECGTRHEEGWGSCRFCGEHRPLTPGSDLCTWCHESMTQENPSWRVSGTLEQVPDAAAPAAPRRRGRPPKLAVVPPPAEPEAPAAEDVPFEVPGQAEPRRGFQPGERVSVPYSGRESYFGRQTSRTREKAIVEGYHLEGSEPMVQVRVHRGRSVEDHIFPESKVRRLPRSGQKLVTQARPAIRARLERKVRGSLEAAQALYERLSSEHRAAEAIAREWYGFKPKYGETNKAFHNARAKMRRLELTMDVLSSMIRDLGGEADRSVAAFGNPFHNRHGAAGASRTVRGNSRKINPRGSERDRAVQTFKMWHEFEPHRVTRMKGPPRIIPKTLVKLGEIRAIDYISDKWEGRPVTYTHTTDRPRPVLATDPDGRYLHIVGGRVRVTADGLVH